MFRRRSSFRRGVPGRSWWHKPRLHSQLSGTSGAPHAEAPAPYTLLLTLLVVAVVALGAMLMARAPVRPAHPRRTARSRDVVDRLAVANEEALRNPVGGSVVVGPAL